MEISPHEEILVRLLKNPCYEPYFATKLQRPKVKIPIVLHLGNRCFQFIIWQINNLINCNTFASVLLNLWSLKYQKLIDIYIFAKCNILELLTEVESFQGFQVDDKVFSFILSNVPIFRISVNVTYVLKFNQGI